jgi:hypothetical protein
VAITAYPREITPFPSCRLQPPQLRVNPGAVLFLRVGGSLWNVAAYASGQEVTGAPNEPNPAQAEATGDSGPRAAGDVGRLKAPHGAKYRTNPFHPGAADGPPGAPEAGPLRRNLPNEPNFQPTRTK